jgi:hypothetical protein
MEALQAMEDNMANVKRELKEVKETIIETKAAKTTRNTWANITAMLRAPPTMTATMDKNLTKRASRSKLNTDKREQRSKLHSLLRELHEQHKPT